jgi:acetoin utilization deacetylase AcuC-like enzyme
MKVKPIIIYHPDYLIHTQAKHPERKERLESILAALDENELTEWIELAEPLPATVEELALIHDPEYITFVEKACLTGHNYMDMDTYLVPDSYRIALLSAGGAITGLNQIIAQKRNKVFVLNRPPGHHAERSKAMGFCLFNNVAIAAAKAIHEYNFQRIAIVDWDVHHGNGTQHSFEDDPQVLYISTHQSPGYPGSGNLDEVGVGAGEGFTVNLPLPAGCGDSEYESCFREVIIPIIDQYKPEIIIVSAGQDAYRLDPLAGMLLSHYGYFMMAKMLADAADRWSDGKMLLCLEGGYHLQGQADAIIQILNALGQWGLPVEKAVDNFLIDNYFSQRLKDIKTIQRKYWDI